MAGSIKWQIWNNGMINHHYNHQRTDTQYTWDLVNYTCVTEEIRLTLFCSSYFLTQSLAKTLTSSSSYLRHPVPGRNICIHNTHTNKKNQIKTDLYTVLSCKQIRGTISLSLFGTKHNSWRKQDYSNLTCIQKLDEASFSSHDIKIKR